MDENAKMPHTKRTMKKLAEIKTEVGSKARRSLQIKKISGKDLSVLAILAQHPRISAARKSVAFNILSKDAKKIAEHLKQRASGKAAKSAAFDSASELRDWAQSNRL